MKVFCYYHDDMDGKCSGAIVKQQIRDAELVKVNNAGIQHPDFSQVSSGDCVYLVDLSVGFEGFIDLFERTKHVVWIDHHSSSFSTLIELGRVFDLDTLTSFKRLLSTQDGSACVLVWQWFHGLKAYPNSVHLTSLYDTWEYTLGDKVMLFNLGCENVGLEPDDQLWKMLLRVEDPDADSLISEIVRMGDTILGYQKSRYNRLKNYAHSATLDGVSFVAVNTDSSNIFLRKSGASSLDPSASRMLLYDRVGKDWIYHLYGDSENEVDLAKLAESYGGGGHPQAAGFVLDHLLDLGE